MAPRSRNGMNSMRRPGAVLAVIGLLVSVGAGAAAGQDSCAGDCNGDRAVAINELVTCVNVALGAAAVSSCPSCDPNGDGGVAINELIAAVNAALAGCGGTTTGFCGDGEENVAGEECDDGNNVGADGCAANCTHEARRVTLLDPARSKATIQLPIFPLERPLTGQQVLTTGWPRDTAVIGPGGQRLFNPGESPIAIKAVDVQFDPISVPGIGCGCVRAIPNPDFGEGLSGVGVVGCGVQGLSNVSFRIEQDHNTTPGDPENSGSAQGLPDDPECDDHTDAGGGLVSDACKEGVGAACSEPRYEHGVCNSPRVATFFGGQAPRGSVMLRNSTAIGVLGDLGACSMAGPNRNGSCDYEDYGPDCLPCTDDDLEKGTTNVAPLSSGTAEAVLYDANNAKGLLLGLGGDCGGTPCVGQVTGASGDCDAVFADPNAPLTSTLATAFPAIDNDLVGDTVVTLTLAGQQ